MRLETFAAAALAAVAWIAPPGDLGAQDPPADGAAEPAVLAVVLDSDGVISAAGVLPDGLTTRDLSDALPGVDTSMVSTGGSGDAAAWDQALIGLAAAFPRFSTVVIRIGEGRIDVGGTLRDGFSAGDASAAIRSAAGPGWSVALDIREAPPEPVFALVRIAPGLRAPDEREAERLAGRNPDRGLLEVAGVLPDPLNAAAARAALVLEPGVRTAVSGGASGEAETWGTGMIGLGALSRRFLRLEARLRNGQLTATGRLRPGETAAEAEAVFRRIAGDAWEVELSAVPTRARDGDVRIDREAGRREIYRGGHWVPDFDFSVSADDCNQAAGALLAEQQVTFVTGSDEIEAEDARLLDRLAGVAHHCLGVRGKRFLIGGHTDAVGVPFANLALSTRRAATVRAEIVARGVAPEALVAIGYGAFRPMADNATAEGRAANRRITFAFVEPEP